MFEEQIEVSKSASARNFLIRVVQDQVYNQLPIYADKEHFLYLHVLFKAIEDYFSNDARLKESAIRYFYRRFNKKEDIFEIHAFLLGSDPDWIRYELKKCSAFRPKLEKLLSNTRGKAVTKEKVQELLSTMRV